MNEKKRDWSRLHYSTMGDLKNRSLLVWRKIVIITEDCRSFGIFIWMGLIKKNVTYDSKWFFWITIALLHIYRRMIQIMTSPVSDELIFYSHWHYADSWVYETIMNPIGSTSCHWIFAMPAENLCYYEFKLPNSICSIYLPWSHKQR